MAKAEALAEVVNDQVYTDYDSLATIQFCTPSFVGCKVCVSVNSQSNYIALTLQGITPFGSYSKVFNINNNVCFTWQPLGLFKVEVCIKQFQKIGKTFSFSISLKGCLKVPIWGWKCLSYSKSLSVPAPFNETHAGFFGSDTDEIDEKDFGTFLALYALAADNEKADCNCH